MLTLIVPGLLGVGAALKRVPALQTLAHYADAPMQYRDGIGAAIAAAFGLPRTTPLAPVCALGAGVDDDDRYTIAATPVTLVADRDVVVLAGRVGDLRSDEAAAFVDALNRHFATDGVEFAAARASTWYARCQRAYTLTMPSLEAAIGRPIRPFLPIGVDAPLWQRWQVEIQMLFHEHRFNRDRDDARRAPVTTVWFWGGGCRSDVGTPTVTTVWATDGEDGDLARGLARHAGLSADTLPMTISPIIDRHRTDEQDFVSLNAVHDENAVVRFSQDWLQPAVAALEKGAVRGLRLVTDGYGAALAWAAAHPSPFTRMTARLRHRTFDVPAAAEP